MAFVEAENYRFYYPEQLEPAVAVDAWLVPRGTMCLLAGASGCGKTTLLRQLAGESSLQGREEGRLQKETGRTAYVWQDPENQIVTDSVGYEILFGLENIGMPEEQMKRRLAEIVTAFGLEELVERDTMQLSGGEKQILNVASSLAMNPELLLLDEPTSQLDPVAARRLYDLLYQINEEYGITIVIAEQRLEDIVPMVDQITCMERGRIVAAGEPREVFARVQKGDMADFFPAYMKLGANALSKKEARLWFEKHYESVGEERNPDKRTEAAETGIAVKDVFFRYERKGKDVLKGCSGSFCKGKITCLAGGNGSGKTTLLRILAGQIRAYHGRVKKMPQRAAYLPQDPSYLFLEETVEAECGRMTEQGRALCQRFGLPALADRHPSDLSGGEKQRLGLSFVLGQEAEVYLLDEPTKGMDARAKRCLGEILQEWTKRGKLVLMVSHDMEFAARYSDEMALMFQGKILLQSESRAFFEENQFYTTSMNRVAGRVNPHIITIEDVERYAKKKGKSHNSGNACDRSSGL